MSEDSDDEGELNDFKRKTLLAKIERRNISRQDVDLKQICDQDLVSFGKSGGKLRREVQLFWKNVKGQSIRNYARRLEQEGIVIGDGSRRDLQDLGTAESPPTPPSDSFAEEEAEETEDSSDILTPFIQDLSIRHFSKKGRAVSFGSSPPASRKLNFDIIDTMASSNKPSLESSTHSKGSRGNPFIIHLNTDHPENNSGFELTMSPESNMEA